MKVLLNGIREEDEDGGNEGEEEEDEDEEEELTDTYRQYRGSVLNGRI